MLVEFFGPNSNYFTEAFFGDTGFEIVLNASPSSIRLEFIQPDTGVSVTFIGTGFSVDVDDNPTGGTITEMHFSDPDGTDVASFTGFSWDLLTFIAALEDAAIDDSSALEALFNVDPITVDATGATSLYDMTNIDISLTSAHTIDGSAFDDTLKGGSGNDLIFGRDGADTMLGGKGKDTLKGNSGNDLIFGGAGDDKLYGGFGDDNLFGDKGADTLNGGDGFDAANYSLGSAGILVDWVAGSVVDSWGKTDTFADIEIIVGTQFDDEFKGGAGTQYFYSLGGNDNVTGKNGDDYLFGGGGDDVIDGGNGNDWIFGESDNDELHGGTGNDYIDGGSGNDVIYDGDGDDTVAGGAGNDVFMQGSGYDSFDGGAGRDTLYVDLTQFDLPVDFQGYWDLDAGVGGRVGSAVLADTVTNVENVTVFGDWDYFLTGDAEDNSFTSEGGNDSVYGNDGKDTIFSGAGNDFLVGGSGQDHLSGQRGKDTLKGGGGADIIDGGGAKDKLFGGNGADTFIFDSANDSTNNNKADVIKDFEIGTDLIDLSGVASGLGFIGTDGFSGTANEVRATVNGGGDTLVRVDVDGDGSADMKIILEGVAGVTSGDFLL